MELSYVDGRTKCINGVKYLPVRHDLFVRTVNATGIKTKDSKVTVCAFSTLITKKIDSVKIGPTDEQTMQEILKIFAELKT